jgi:hypothetical protein
VVRARPILKAVLQQIETIEPGRKMVADFSSKPTFPR